jgi:hypothetical protein
MNIHLRNDKSIDEVARKSQSSRYFVVFFFLSCSVIFMLLSGFALTNHSVGDDNVKRGRRMASGKECQNLYWLHAPKTSSTLCMTLHHICCPEDFELSATFDYSKYQTKTAHEFVAENVTTERVRLQRGCALPQGYQKSRRCNMRLLSRDQHAPLPRTKSFVLRGSLGGMAVITMLRDPRHRLISAYLDGAHHEGMSDEGYSNLFHVMGPQLPDFSMANSKQHLKRAQVYADHGNMVGCYTKMLNGYECHSRYITRHAPFNNEALEKAVKVLNKFYFVGLMEHYNTSITILHKMLGKNTSPHDLERSLTRKQKRQSVKTFLLKHINYTDAYDEVIYAEAKRIFSKFAERYAVPISQRLNDT